MIRFRPESDSTATTRPGPHSTLGGQSPVTGRRALERAGGSTLGVFAAFEIMSYERRGPPGTNAGPEGLTAASEQAAQLNTDV